MIHGWSGRMPHVPVRDLAGAAGVFVVGSGSSQTYGVAPTPSPNPDITFEADDFVLLFAAHRTNNNNTIAFAAPWAAIAGASSVTAGDVATGSFHVGRCRYGDAVFGAAQYSATSAASGSSLSIVLRGVRLSDPIGDVEIDLANSDASLATDTMTLAASGANVVVATHYRRGTSSFFPLLTYPGAPFTAVRRIDDGDILGNMAFGITPGAVTTQGAITAPQGGGTAWRVLVGIEIKRAL